MIRWPCLCLVCWSHFQEFLKKAQTQKAGKKTKTKDSSCSVHWFFQPPATKSPGFNPLKGPIGSQAHQNGFRCGVRGSATEKALGIPMLGISTGDREMVYIEQKKWHSRYYYTYLYINCDHVAVFDLYPMVEIVGGRMLGCPTFNPCHPCPNLVDMRYIEIHYRSLYTMPPCLLLSLKTPFALREVWLQDWLVFGIRDSIAIFKGKLPLEWVYSMSLPTSDHPPQ